MLFMTTIFPKIPSRGIQTIFFYSPIDWESFKMINNDYVMSCYPPPFSVDVQDAVELAARAGVVLLLPPLGALVAFFYDAP